MKYRKEFFKNFCLRLSRFGEFNDPFEMLPGNYAFTLNKDEYSDFMECATHLKDPCYHMENAIEINSGVRASIGVICFTTHNANLLMWSHYADEHKGICIEFDTENSFFQGKYSCDYYQNVGIVRKVDYRVERPLIIDPRELVKSTEFWFVKSPEWQYEDEYRLLLPIDNAIQKRIKNKSQNNDLLLFYKISPKLIKSVTLGCQMPVETKQKVFSLCSDLGIKVRECFVHASEFRLDIVDYHPKNHGKFVNFYNMNRVAS